MQGLRLIFVTWAVPNWGPLRTRRESLAGSAILPTRVLIPNLESLSTFEGALFTHDRAIDNAATPKERGPACFVAVNHRPADGRSMLEGGSVSRGEEPLPSGAWLGGGEVRAIGLSLLAALMMDAGRGPDPLGHFEGSSDDGRRLQAGAARASVETRGYSKNSTKLSAFWEVPR
jgi:hypothetical protein